MRLATKRDGTADGELVVVAPDGKHCISARAIAPTLQAALERWNEAECGLRALAAEAATGHAVGLEALSKDAFCAPLPRAWQWLDGSAYPNHGMLMQQAFGMPLVETDRPLMYQGLSDRFLGPRDDVPLPCEADGIDFEGEFGIIVDKVPMGVTAEAALDHIKLVVQINDWSLRMLAPGEMKTGFGWVQAKPACGVAPFAVTPDALGGCWTNGRVSATLAIALNGKRIGSVDSGAEMEFGFHDLVAHAARTRMLVAGTIIGSGTVSATNYREMGSSCLSERRAIDAIEGRDLTPFMLFGDRVRMEAFVDGEPLFGIIDQQVIRA